MEKNNKNIWRIAWIVGVYALLVVILYLVVLYKVKWEYLDLNEYLYFYDCSNNLCSTENKVDEYYSKVLCKENVCPYITSKKDNFIILKSKDDGYVFDYVNDKIVNNDYIDYRFAENNFLIVTDMSNLQGVINYDGEVIVDFNYDEISNYKNNYVVYKEDGKYGLDSDIEGVHTDTKYKDIVLINKRLFAYKDDDNNYYIASYSTLLPVSNTMYDYIASVGDLVITIRNKQLDILDGNLSSKLLMKVDTYYTYKTDKEIKTLNLYVKDDILHFSLHNSNNENKNYTFDLKTEKLSTN